MCHQPHTSLLDLLPRTVEGRSFCPVCKHSRKFYCYTCYEYVGLDGSLLPTVRLPVSVDMYVH